MNKRHYIFGVVAVWAFICLAEILFHTIILQGIYRVILGVIRPEQYFGPYYPLLIIGHLLLSLLFCYIFIKGYENRGLWEGVRFGLIVGLALGVAPSLVQFTTNQFPGKFVIAWVVWYPLEMTVAGIIIAAIYRPPAQKKTRE